MYMLQRDGENAGQDNTAGVEMQDWKMTDRKMREKDIERTLWRITNDLPTKH